MRQSVAAGRYFPNRIAPVGGRRTLKRLTIARGRGVAISTRDYLMIRVVTITPVLIAVALALWLNRT